ncbi:MAG: carboxypeptidase-like regulatory domain-containing protein [Chloroflexi bacterium]|nr:carboxypeptidase-like regulatory domain-containing protein [Chloroflexota bacterium]
MRALAQLAAWLAAALVAGGVALGWSPAPEGAAAQSSTRHEIRGTVSGPSGEPLEGITVQAWGEYGGDTFRHWTAVPTDTAGSFRMEVPAGMYRLRLSLEFEGSGGCFLGYFGSDGRRGGYGEVALVAVAGGDVEGLAIALSGVPSEVCHEVEGVVVDSEGEPVVKRQVSFGEWWEWGNRNEWTDTTGRFRLHLWEGRYLIKVGTELGAECRVEGHEGAEPGRPARIDVVGETVEGLRITLSTGAYASPTTSAGCSFPPRMVTTTLRPGWNLAGWTAEGTDVEALFEAIPALEAIHAWDAGAQSFTRATRDETESAADLTTIAPGMGLWLHLGGEEPVTWTRPVAPEAGIVSLRPGWNLVAWGGRDEAAPEDAFAFLREDLLAAAAWESAAGEFRLHYPDAPPSASTLQRLELGEALWLNVGVARHWLQPGAAASAVEFVGEVAPKTRADLEPRIDDVLAYFGERTGFFVPGITISVGEHRVGCGDYGIGFRTIRLREGCLRALAHEYAHAVQLTAGHGESAAWLVEGVAERWSDQYDGHAGNDTAEADGRDEAIRSTRFVEAALADMESHAGFTAQGAGGYGLAHLAADWLATIAGGDGALFGYFDARTNEEDWQVTFERVFGMGVDDFYTSFAAHRAQVAPPYATVEGVVLGPDGQPQEDVKVQYFSSEDDPFGLYGGRTDGEGRFNWAIESGSYSIGLTRGDGCPLPWHTTDHRLGAVVESRASIDVGNVDIEGLTLTLSRSPAEVCRDVQGVVTDLVGNPTAGVFVTPLPADGQRPPVFSQVTTDPSGTFVVTLRRGQYRLQVRPPTPSGAFGGRGYYGGETGFVLRRSEARLIDTRAATLPEIVIASGTIGGTILTADGQPVKGVAVYPGERAINSPTSDSRGRFEVSVPKGVHTLELVCPQGGGGWFGGSGTLVANREQATPIVVDTADVTGIVINLPVGVTCQ